MKGKLVKCNVCKLTHKVYDDGFDYLSCMLALKLKDKETNISIKFFVYTVKN